MNVYDFDGTIYKGDSTRDFWLFSVGRHFKCFWTAPATSILGIGYVLKIVDRDKLKSHLYPFVTAIPDIDKEIELFWKTHEKKVLPWYLEQKKPDDVIISASPEFIVKPMADKLGAALIASPVDRFTGQLLGPNNHGERKVERFKKLYKDAKIDEFYSDKHTDDPLAALSESPHIVRRGKIYPWSKK